MNPFWSMSTSSVRKVGTVDKFSEETICSRIEARIIHSEVTCNLNKTTWFF